MPSLKRATSFFFPVKRYYPHFLPGKRMPFLFFFTLVTGPRRSLILKLSDTRVYEPQIRARLGTTLLLAGRSVFSSSSLVRSSMETSDPKVFELFLKTGPPDTNPHVKTKSMLFRHSDLP